MPLSKVVYEKSAGIRKIRLNRPESLNALRIADLLELRDAVRLAGEDVDVGVIVLTGVGSSFCVGVDLKSLKTSAIKDGRVGAEWDNAGNGLINAIEAVPKVVIAMVTGYCITGGLEIALACDFIIASEEAKFADSHVRLGLRCSWGMSQRLPARIGYLKAKEMTFTAQMISATEALNIGLVNQVISKDNLENAVDNLAQTILRNSASAIAAHKHLYNSGIARSCKAGLYLEGSSNFLIDDTVERLMAFEEKRQGGIGKTVFHI